MTIRDRIKGNYTTPVGMGVFIWWCAIRGIADPKALSDDDLERTWAKFQIEMSDAERQAFEPKLENPAVGDPWAVGTLVPGLWSQELTNKFYKAALDGLTKSKPPQTLQAKRPDV